MTRSPRRTWLRIHRWVALTAGWAVAMVCVLGAILVIAQPLDRALHPHLFEATGRQRAISYETIRQRLRGSLGRDIDLTIRPPREPDDTLWVKVRGGWTGTVYVDPATGEELGRRSDDDSIVSFVFRLHSSLLLKDAGKPILAGLALVYLIMLVTGLVLWWPRRWPPSWHVEWQRGGTRRLFDLHRTGGAAVGLLIAVSVATGGYMAWRPIGDALSALVGDRKIVPPTLDIDDDDSGPRPSLDTMVETVHTQFPNDAIGFIQDDARRDRPLRIRMKLADDPHPNGLTTLWMDPRRGTILRVDRWNGLDLGAKIVAVLYPLHTGALGGPFLEAVVFIDGIVLGALAVTGTWLWWRRRERVVTNG